MLVPYFDLEKADTHALSNVKIRKAVSLTIDRKEMSDKMLGGYAEPSGLFYGRPSAYFWDANALKTDSYDPEGAKKLMAEAGFPDGFSTKLWNTEGIDLGNNLNAAVSGYLKKAGINADQVAVSNASLRAMRVPAWVEG